MGIFSAFTRYKEIIVLPDYSFSGGGARPIYSYYRHKVNAGHTDILFLRLITRNSTLKLLLLCLFRNRLIINGIASFYYWPVHLACYLKKDVVIYLHEAGPHVEAFRDGHPLLHRSLKWILARRKAAFVSDWQEQYFREHYKLGKTAVVNNAMALPPAPSATGTNIVMIAYQTRNKNVDFFSRIADHAQSHGLPYRFHWVGGDGGDMHGLYHSPHVTWWGDQEQVMDLLNAFDLLLFTSKSDTFGLVIAEALYKGKRVVSYRENGLAGQLQRLSGCRVFETFDEEAVLRDIAAALAEPVDVAANRHLVAELCSVEQLERGLNELFAR